MHFGGKRRWVVIIAALGALIAIALIAFHNKKPEPPRLSVATTQSAASRPIIPAFTATPLNPKAMQAVDRALRMARQFFISSQKDGRWDKSVPEGGNWIGDDTPLVLWALLHIADPKEKPESLVSVRQLMGADCDSTELLAQRVRICALLPTSSENNSQMRFDALELVKRTVTTPRQLSLHTLSVSEKTGSLIASAQASCALDEMVPNQVIIPSSYWKLSQLTWRAILERELREGIAMGPEHSTAGSLLPILRAMDVLMVTQDRADLRQENSATDLALQHGLEAVEANYPALFRGPDEFETLDMLSRVMRKLGLRKLAGHDWYQESVELFLSVQRADGSWGNGMRDTAYAVLFLSQSRSPVLINKLQLAAAPSQKTLATKASDRQDLYHFTRWLSSQFNAPFDWRRVSIDDSVNQWLTAPILYITSEQALNLSDIQIAKLKQYIEQGGLILGNPELSNNQFAARFERLGKQMFPAYQFRTLASRHPLFAEPFRAEFWTQIPQVRGLSNGEYELMLLLPGGPIASVKALDNNSPPAQLVANMIAYTTDYNFHPKEEFFNTPLNPESIVAANHVQRIIESAVADLPKPAYEKKKEPPLRSATLAIIGPSGDPQSIPAFAALRAALLTHHTQLSIDPLVLGKWNLQHYDIASIPAERLSKLGKLERLEVKRFVETGGTLLVDSSANPTKLEGAQATISRLLGTPALRFERAPELNDPPFQATGQVIRIATVYERGRIVLSVDQAQNNAVLEHLLLSAGR